MQTETNTVIARYLSGDEVTLTDCPTVRHVRVKIANLAGDKYPHDVTVLTMDGAEMEEGELNFLDGAARVLVVLKESAKLSADNVQLAIKDYAKVGDTEGMRRIQKAARQQRLGRMVTIDRYMLARCLDGDCDYALVRSFVDCGLDPNARCRKGLSLLMDRSESSEAARALIDCQADLNYAAVASVDRRQVLKRTALERCIRSKMNKTVDVLIASKADIDVKALYNHSMLMVATEHCNKEAAKALIAANADINYRTPTGYSALSVAACGHQASVVRLLLEARADPNSLGHKGCTMLGLAVVEANRHYVWRIEAELVQLLLEGRADINQKNRRGETVLDCLENKEHEYKWPWQSKEKDAVRDLRSKLVELGAVNSTSLGSKERPIGKAKASAKKALTKGKSDGKNEGSAKKVLTKGKNDKKTTRA